jgi:MFS family permease
VTSDVNAPPVTAPEAESTYAWLRLVAVLIVSTIGGAGMWSMAVLLPPVQAEFGVARGDASLPFTLTMCGFALGGVLMGRLMDRFGAVVPVVCGAITLCFGAVAAANSPSLVFFAFSHLLLGIGSSAMFGPLMADISHWFTRRRGIAVAVAASGNSLAGAVWPPILQHFVQTVGWRQTLTGMGIFSVAVILPIAILVLRRRVSAHTTSAAPMPPGSRATLGISSSMLMTLLCTAGVACCVAMAMPQVHIVAYCGDLGFGPVHGADMLAVMMTFGIVSRLACGIIADRIGGVATLLWGSVLQAVALLLYIFFNGLTSLYVISALFGLFQGGIIPSYAIIIREYFPPREAGTRVGIVLMSTLLGMALGGWMAGVLFDLTGSYRAAFLNGLIWNLLNVAIMIWLLGRPARRLATA